MDDPIFDQGDPSATPGTPAAAPSAPAAGTPPSGEAGQPGAPDGGKPAAAPATPTAATPAAPDPQVVQLTHKVDQLINQLSSLANTPAEQPPPPPREPSEQLQDLASNPQEFVSRTAREEAQRLVNEAVNPVIMQTVDVASRQLLGAHAANIDGQFGAGTWDEIFKPTIEQDLTRLREANPRATADPTIINMLVDRLQGGSNFAKLVERQQAHKTSLTEQEKAGLEKIISQIPTGGIPRLRPGSPDGELPEDVEAWLKHVDAETGRTTDRKHFAKLYATGESTGRTHRTTVLDYLNAAGANAETIKQHGG